MQSQRNSLTLKLQEGVVGEALPTDIADALHRWGRPVLKRLGIKLAAAVGPDGELRWLARTTNLVGSAVVHCPAFRVLLMVEPKLPNSQVLDMISFAAREGAGRSDLAAVPVAEGGLTEYFALGLAREIRDCVSKGLRRDYLFRTDTLHCRIRGRLALERYLRQSVARGKPNDFVCRTLEYTSDLPQNRTLKTALDTLRRIARNYEGSIGTLTLMQASAALRCLSNVPSSQNPIRDAEEALRTSSDPTLHRVLTLCILLFRNQGQALNHGAEELRAGFVLDMAWLFERYVRALLSTALGALAFPYKRTLVYNVDGVDSSIELDGLVQLPDQRIVIECKYRRVVDSAGAIMRDRWSSEHVYQAVAYASHRDVDAQAAVLIFPHVGLAEPLIEHAHIGSFAKSTTGVRLRVWSISLDKPANQVVTALALRARTLLK